MGWAELVKSHVYRVVPTLREPCDGFGGYTSHSVAICTMLLQLLPHPPLLLLGLCMALTSLKLTIYRLMSLRYLQRAFVEDILYSVLHTVI